MKMVVLFIVRESSRNSSWSPRRMSGSRAEKGLVHQQDLGVGGERARKPHALLHPTRQLARHAVAIALQADRFNHAVGHLVARERVRVAKLQREGDVVAHGAVRQERHVLEHHADAIRPQGAQLLRRERADVLAVDEYLSAGRLSISRLT